MRKIPRLLSYLVLLLPLFVVYNVHASTTFQTCTVNEPSYFRSSPNGSVMTDVDQSSVLVRSPMRLEVLEEKDGCKKVRGNYYSNNYVGWINNKYLTDYKSYTTDDNYGQSLRNAGFPESYILPLQKLHAIHPNWNFIVSKYGNGLNFNDAVSGEYSPVSKNLINSPYTALRSTDGDAYNNGTYKQYEPGWYAASRQTLEFYMDPRNWLTENTVFMFEQLSYNSTSHTVDAVEKILAGSFLSGHGAEFVNAGKTYNVSPVALAAKVIQEQGVSGSRTANMSYNGQTYHNYFNINANGSTADAIYNNALQTAVRSNWTTSQAAINGGANVYSSNYIGLGQDTSYYQRFNTINGRNLYWNQYMTNVRALPSESYSAYLGYYKTGKLDSSIAFKIPVYNNIPDSTTLSINGNGDNSLKSLKVSNCSINFYSSVVNYTCSTNASSVNVSGERASSYSTVKGFGDYNLTQNTTNIQVVVTAANGNQKVYNITITKGGNSSNNTNNNNTNNNSNNNNNNNNNNSNNNNTNVVSPTSIMSILGLSNRSNVLYGVSLGENRTNVVNVIKSKGASNVVIRNKENTVVNNGNVGTGDKFIVTSGSVSTEFTMVINGDPSGDGNVDISDLAMVKAKMLGKINFNQIVFDAADVNNDNVVDISDLAMIKAHMLGKYRITK